MPYYVYRITESAGALVKQLDLLETFESYRNAKLHAKQTRMEQAAGDSAIIKVMFADNQLAAEEQLMEKREQPIVMEREK